MNIQIPVHSFIDVITNSSSETFVTADRKSIDAFQDLIDKVLKAGGSDKKCSDLFRLALEERNGGYGDYKVLVAHPKDPACVDAATAISTVNDMFMVENVGND